MVKRRTRGIKNIAIKEQSIPMTATKESRTWGGGALLYTPLGGTEIRRGGVTSLYTSRGERKLGGEGALLYTPLGGHWYYSTWNSIARTL